MSLSEEKLLILKMLEEGKITSEEAAKLIDALEGDNKSTSGEGSAKSQRNAFSEEASKVKDRVNEWKKNFKNSYDQKDFDSMIDDFSVKAEKLGKNVAATTIGVVDKIIDFVGSFVDTNSFNVFGSYTTVEKEFEAVAIEEMQLDVEAANGNIMLKKHLDNKIVIKSKVKSPANTTENILIFNNDDMNLSLKVNNTGTMSVSHEIFVPAVLFGKIRLETTNGKIYVEDSLSKEFEALTKNSHIELMGVNSDRISVSTMNAKIQIAYVVGREIVVNTKNAVVDIKHVKAEKIIAVTKNGRIMVENAQNYEGTEKLDIDLKTTNGSIKIDMNDMDNRVYKVKAKTTNGGINLLIPEMTYHNVNRQGVGGSFIEAESAGYESSVDRVFINAETQNGYIEIVK